MSDPVLLPYSLGGLDGGAGLQDGTVLRLLRGNPLVGLYFL